MPSESKVAWSPRSCVTLPTSMTFWPTHESRYGAEMRGAESWGSAILH